MGSETILFKSEGKKTKTEVGNFLRLIADKVEQGELTLSNNVGEVDLDGDFRWVVKVYCSKVKERKRKLRWQFLIPDSR